MMGISQRCTSCMQLNMKCRNLDLWLDLLFIRNCIFPWCVTGRLRHFLHQGLVLLLNDFIVQRTCFTAIELGQTTINLKHCTVPYLQLSIDIYLLKYTSELLGQCHLWHIYGTFYMVFIDSAGKFQYVCG